ncbi:MAG: hypothetical protein IJ600_02330 [Lachnospiraceae bacterium]|nr:hypothetical protein [Lachnospiraceae bacterium]
MKKASNWISRLPALLSVLLFSVLAAVKKPLYILNDDLQIQAILSGSYTGRPDLHTVYLRAPLSFIVSFLYRLFPECPWFGLLLCGTFALCAYLFLQRCTELWLKSASDGGAEPAKRAVVLREVPAALLCGWAMLLPFLAGELLLPHYTMAAACAGAAGLFLLMTAPQQAKPREKTRAVIAALLLLLLCDQLRSQVFYMLCPFLGLAALYRFLLLPDAAERRQTIAQMLPVCIAAAAVWLALFGLDRLAYAGEDWQAFRKLNAARTRLYDYTLVWESEEAKAYYRSLGVSEAAYPLYRHFDLLPDPAADTARMDAMADFEEPSRAASKMQKFRNVIYDLRVRTLGLSGKVPYGWLLLALGAGGTVVVLRQKKYRLLLPLFGCMAGHFLIYGWLLWRGRMPERVTDSLYQICIVFLLAVLWKAAGRQRWLLPVAALLCLPVAVSAWMKMQADTQIQSSVNRQQDVIYSYVSEYPERLFLMETYTAVNRTVSAGCADASDGNVLLLGGWLYGSPLQREKLQRFGYTKVQELFAGGGAYYVCRRDVGLRPAQLQDFLREQYGTQAVQLVQECVLQAGETVFEIYRLEG